MFAGCTYQLVGFAMLRLKWFKAGESLNPPFPGILDQGTGVLVVFDESEADKTYETALDTIQNMGKVVDALYSKAKKLS